MPLSADELTRIAVMQFFREQQDANAVQCQLQSIKVIDCNVTSVGLVRRFHVDPNAPKVRSGTTGRLGGIEGRLFPSGVKCGFELWIEGGRIASLEAFTYSDDWPNAIEACQFSPTDHVKVCSVPLSWQNANEKMQPSWRRLFLTDVLHTAVDDSQAERYEDALQKFLWFHEASRSDCGMGGVRLSFALGYWMDLASHYAPALDAFINLRDELERQCCDNHGDFESFHEVSAFNRYLNDDRRTIDLFTEIASEHPENAGRLYHVAERILVAEKMYQQCAPFLDWEQRIETSISAYRTGLNYESSWTDLETAPPRFARQHFENETVTLVALLAFNGRQSEAEQVRDRCLAVLNDAAFRETLELALTGHFPDTEDGRTMP